MALKDLTIKESVLAEKQVEEIVSKYVRYDVKEKQIHFLPAFNPLTNRRKVLVYLVALHGWPFITNETPPLEATPGMIGKAINLEGGTLRPTLKELKDAHIISATGRLYRVHSAALDQIKDILEGGVQGEGSIKGKSKVKKGKRIRPSKKGSEENRGKRKGQRDLLSAFKEFISNGFFDHPRVIGDVKDRFAERGLNVPLNTIPKYLLKATNEKILTRKKKEIKKKRVWVYERKK